MGLFFRPRRPLMRVAAGAATAGIAYHAGKRRVEQDAYNDQVSKAYDATQAPPPPQPAYAPGPRRPAARQHRRAGAPGPPARVGRADRRGVLGGKARALGI